MIRNLVVLALLVFGGFFVGLYLAYHTMDPCRALAVEDARRSTMPTTVAHVWTRIETAQMDRLHCSRGLLRSWQDRLSR